MKRIFRDAAFVLFDFEPAICCNWAEAAFELSRHEIPLNQDVHPLLWQYIPQTDRYRTIGLFAESGITRYENFSAARLPGEVGILISMFRACILFLESNLEYLVWCEDDAMLYDQFAIELKRLLGHECPEFDFIRLVETGDTSVPEMSEIDGSPLIYPTHYIFTQSVLVSRQGAEKFITYLKKFGCSLPLDWIIYNVQSDITRSHSFNSYFIKPETFKLTYLDPAVNNASTIRPKHPKMSFPNWFSSSAANFSSVPHRDTGIRVLQIGVFTGDATEWLLMNRKIEVIHDVDTWEGSGEEHEAPLLRRLGYSEFIYSEAEAFYDLRCSGTPLVKKFKMTSNAFFSLRTDKSNRESSYDFVYIDGDHTASQTAIDCLNAFSRLEVGGVMAIDDYLWFLKGDKFLEPKLGVDAFLMVIEGRYERLIDSYQLWIRKTK